MLIWNFVNKKIISQIINNIFINLKIKYLIKNFHESTRL